MPINVQGQVRANMTQAALSQYTVAQQNEYSEMLVANGLPNFTALVQQGKIYTAGTGAGTAIAPVASWPTTAGTWELYNGNTQSSGVCLVLIEAACWSVSGTLGLGMSLLLGTRSLVATTIPTAYASSVGPTNVDGKTTGSNAIFAQGTTLGGTPVWRAVASRDQVSAVSVGSGLVARIDGLAIARPGFGHALTVLAPTGTSALFGVNYTWAEIALNTTNM